MTTPPQLTVSEIKEKIDRVDIDIKRFEANGDSLMKVMVLQEYKKYLEHELNEAQKSRNP
jgi:RNase H-fold protein (predicted Holliday junction resolvase)